MNALSAPFSAGTLHWMRLGPCHAAPQRYDRVKLSVLLGGTTRRWRASALAPWQPVPAGSFSLCLSGRGAETQFAGDGQFFALNLDAGFLARTLARFPDAARTDLDLHGARDPFLFHLATEAVGVLRRDAIHCSIVSSTSITAPRALHSVAMFASVARSSGDSS